MRPGKLEGDPDFDHQKPWSPYEGPQAQRDVARIENNRKRVKEQSNGKH